MKIGVLLSRLPLALLSLVLLKAQQPASVPSKSATTPRLVKWTGLLKDNQSRPASGITGITFALYKDREGGAPLWMENQNVTLDANGHYYVLLGAANAAGLPAELFSSGEARWLEVEPQGLPTPARMALVSVPYALKAGDAETVGGLPPSAFVLAANAAANTTGPAPRPGDVPTIAAVTPAVTGTGTKNFLPLWLDSAGTLGNSVLFQSGTGTTARIGINNSTPAATLDVTGASIMRGQLSLPATGAATATAGRKSQPFSLAASSFNSGTASAVNQTFQWQAEPSANNTTNPSGTLNLLFGSGTTTPAETGLKLSHAGLFTFAQGQTFPGVGTITGVTAGAGLSGGGTIGSVTLSVPAGGISNTMLQKSSLTLTASGPLTGGGSVALGGSTSLGLKTCSSNQILQFIGGAWTCANLGTGSGTVTSVGLSAPVSDFSVSGSPVTGSGTLGLNWSVAPTSSNTANAIVKRDANGSFNVSGITASGQIVVSNGSIVNPILSQASAANSFAIVGTNTGTGVTRGVYGTSSSSGQGSAGVAGIDNNVSGQTYSGYTVGVNGLTTNVLTGIGVFGELGKTLSNMAINYLNTYAAGVWGDTGAGTNIRYGVIGTSDSSAGILGITQDGVGVNGFALGAGTAVYAIVDGTGDAIYTDSYGGWALEANSHDNNAIVARNESPPAGGGNFAATIYGENTTSAANSLLLYVTAPQVAGGAACSVDSSADLSCTGSVAIAAAVSNGRHLALHAVQSPENWFEDFGEAQLVNGSATVALDAAFAETINLADYHVFLTPRGECEGLYVGSASGSAFQVHELHHGSSNVRFDYRIVAKRLGFENQRLEEVHPWAGRQKPRMHPQRLLNRKVSQPSSPLRPASSAK